MRQRENIMTKSKMKQGVGMLKMLDARSHLLAKTEVALWGRAFQKQVQRGKCD